MNKHSLQLNKLCLSAMFIAVGWLMPFVTGQIPEIGNMLCPMHIPVLLAGFVLGGFYGAVIGFIVPLSRSLLFGMPVLYPIATAMCFELATYGFVAGVLYRLFQKIRKIPDLANLYLTLGIAMLLGRFIWGIARAFCGLFPNTSFTFAAFLSGAFLTAWPGIILQLALIPALVIVLKRIQVLDKFMVFHTSPQETREDRVLKKIKQLTEHSDFYILAIDGMAAAGKTTLAHFLAQNLDANVISMDSFFLPKELRTKERFSCAGGNIHYERFKEEVIHHLGEEITYRSFNCSKMEYDPSIFLQKKKILIIEGCYALHPYFGKYYNYAIFMKISSHKQKIRIEARDPKKKETFLKQWIPLEKAYFKAYNISKQCNEIIKC